MYVWVDSGLIHVYTMHVYMTSGVSKPVLTRR